MVAGIAGMSGTAAAVKVGQVSGVTAASASGAALFPGAPPLRPFRLDLASEQHSATTAVDMAQASLIVYEDEATIRAAFARLGLPNVQFFETSWLGVKHQACIASDGKRAVVAFRGTENEAGDIATDSAKSLVYREGYGRSCLHLGFTRAFERLWQQMGSRVAELAKNGQSIFLTGHSMGGALATVAGAELARIGSPPTGVYTFGSPRVGNRVFTSWYDEQLKDRTFRYVNKMDAVPSVPLVGLITVGDDDDEQAREYFHVGQLHYVSQSGEVRHLPGFADEKENEVKRSIKAEKSQTWWSAVTNKVSAWWNEGEDYELLAATKLRGADHRIASYLQAILPADPLSSTAAPEAGWTPR